MEIEGKDKKVSLATGKEQQQVEGRHRDEQKSSKRDPGLSSSPLCDAQLTGPFLGQIQMEEVPHPHPSSSA